MHKSLDLFSIPVLYLIREMMSTKIKDDWDVTLRKNCETCLDVNDFKIYISCFYDSRSLGMSQFCPTR